MARLGVHDDGPTRDAVALAEIGPPPPEAVPLLVAAFEEEEAPSAEIAYALFRLKAPNADAALDRLVGVAVFDHGGQAQNLLRRLGPAAKPALPALEKALETASDRERPGLESTIAAIRGE